MFMKADFVALMLCMNVTGTTHININISNKTIAFSLSYWLVSYFLATLYYVSSFYLTILLSWFWRRSNPELRASTISFANFIETLCNGGSNCFPVDLGWVRNVIDAIGRAIHPSDSVAICVSIVQS